MGEQRLSAIGQTLELECIPSRSWFYQENVQIMMSECPDQVMGAQEITGR